jgi:diadenosine tetraphosphate (Ap4A) HIT family hydrolase
MIPHAHVHLIPINNPDEFNPQNAKPAKIEELQKIADKILNNE